MYRFEGRIQQPTGISGQLDVKHPGVLNVKLTTDPGRLLYPALEAIHLLTDVVELLQLRSQGR